MSVTTQKLVIEAAVTIVVFVIMLLAWKHFAKKFMYTQTEAEEEAHLKRLFGDAWKEAKDL